MDAYVLAAKASFTEAAELVSRVAEEGPIRVVCPLAGQLGLYVAIAGDDFTSGSTATGLANRLEGARVYIPIPGGLGGIGGDAAAYPTHCEVDLFVGFALLSVPSDSGTIPPLGVDEVVGVAVVRDDDGRVHVLVEVTGPNAATVNAALASLGGHPTLTIERTGFGDVRPAAGFIVEQSNP